MKSPRGGHGGEWPENPPALEVCRKGKELG